MKNTGKDVMRFGMSSVLFTWMLTSLIGYGIGAGGGYHLHSGLSDLLGLLSIVWLILLAGAFLLLLVGGGALSREKEWGLVVSRYGLVCLFLNLLFVALFILLYALSNHVPESLLVLIPFVLVGWSAWKLYVKLREEAARELYQRLQRIGATEAFPPDQPHGISASEAKEAFQKTFQVEIPSTKSELVAAFLLLVLLVGASYIVFYTVRYGWQNLVSNPFTSTLRFVLLLILFVWFCLMRRNF